MAKPIHAKTELKHTEKGTQHNNNGRPTPVCDPYRPKRKDSLVSVCDSYSSSMKGPRLNFHAERELAGHLLAVFWYHKLFATASHCLRLVLNRQARLPTLNSRNSTTAAAPTSQQQHSNRPESISHLETVSPTRLHRVLRSRVNDYGKKWSHG